MCGKFTQFASWRQVNAFSQSLITQPGDQIVISAPMRDTSVLHLDAGGGRTVSQMRWGFADRRSRTPLDRPKHMHARAETIDTLPTFAGPFASSRGIVLVQTFNVGQELQSGKTKQWTITPQGGQPIAIGVIFERWVSEAGDELLTFAMVTTLANKLISPVTDRMPAMIPADRWATWLGETDVSLSEVKRLLQTYEIDGVIQPQAQAMRSAAEPTFL
jgi:putative SOS response-associated peptidase YedK